MLKEAISHLDLFGLAEAATVIFLGVFVVVGIVTLLRPRREMDRMAALPTDELPRV